MLYLFVSQKKQRHVLIELFFEETPVTGKLTQCDVSFFTLLRLENGCNSKSINWFLDWRNGGRIPRTQQDFIVLKLRSIKTTCSGESRDTVSVFDKCEYSQESLNISTVPMTGIIKPTRPIVLNAESQSSLTQGTISNKLSKTLITNKTIDGSKAGRTMWLNNQEAS